MEFSEPVHRLLEAELAQRREEGCRVEGYEKEYQALCGQGDDALRIGADALYDRLMVEPVARGFRHREPSDLEGIHRARPDAEQRLQVPSNLDLRDRILGAWLGRCAGCMLGKPFEGMTKDAIAGTMHSLGAWPLEDYPPPFHRPDEHPGWRERNRGLFRGEITRALRDDDLDYTIIALEILENHGADFTTEQVGATWLARLPYHQTYTAERAAYRNLVANIRPPGTAVWRNPYREWIGAQIRGDCFGYVQPGKPEGAARLAFRDAALSHTKNGIYGEMWVAAMVSAAIATQNLELALDAGLAEIPRSSRLSHAVRNVRRWCLEDDSWERTCVRIRKAYGHYHPVHTINNAAICVMALCHGALDYERSIAIAVMGGWDTDCNGATVGSIAGALIGARDLPGKWIEPLGDELLSAVHGHSKMRISELADRTVIVAERLR